MQPTVFRRRVLSEELGVILKTPGSERGGFDFGTAADEQQEAPIKLTLPKRPGVAPHVRSVLGESDESPDFALEIARLSMTSQMSLPLSLSLPRQPLSPLISPLGDLGPGSPTTPTVNQKTPTAAKALVLPPDDWRGDVAPAQSLAPGVKVLCADDNRIALNILAKLLHGKVRLILFLD